MPFYFLQERDEFDTGIPMGWESGFVESKNDAPAGAEIVENEAALQSRSDRALVEASKAIDAQIAEPDGSESDIVSTIRDNDPDAARKVLKYNDVLALATEMGIETRGKNELTLITEIKKAL